MKKEEKLAALYCRVSTDKQDFTRQITELTIQAKRDGFTDKQITVFGESVSGYKTADRIEFKKLLSEIEETPSKYETIYCWEVSRLGRNPREVRNTIERLCDLGIQVYIKTMDLKTLDAKGKISMFTSIIITILSELANNEAETFKLRSQSGLLHSAKLGRAGGSTNYPYGYTKDKNKMLVVEPSEALIIKDVFSLYQAGNGIKVISNILNERGVPTRINKSHASKTVNFKIPKVGNRVRWSDKQIHDILRNTLYIGKRNFKGQVLDAPAIIKEELFEECKNLMRTKTHRNYLTTYTYLLKDLMSCGCCSRNYFAKYKQDTEKKKGERIYICSSRLIKGGACENGGLNMALIESVIYHQLIKSNSTLKYINDNKTLKVDLEKEVRQLEQQLSSNIKLINTKTQEKERLLDLRLTNDISKEVFTTRQSKIDMEAVGLIQKVERAKSELTKKKTTLQSLDSKKTTRQMLIRARDNRTELQTIYKQIISRIIVNKINTDHFFISIYIQVNGVVLKNTLNLILDVSEMRKKSPSYKYAELPFMNEYEPFYKANKLVGITVDEIYSEVKDYLEFETIPDDNLIILV